MQLGTALINPKLVFDKIKLEPGMRVADFGCGRTGHLVFPSATLVGEDGIVYAVDIVKNILQSIESTAKDIGYNNIKTVWSNIEKFSKTPIPDSTLNAVYFVNVLSQLKDKLEAIREATRLLQKNGFLVIIDWTKKLSILGPKENKIASVEEIKSLTQKMALKDYHQELMGKYHYLYILKKL